MFTNYSTRISHFDNSDYDALWDGTGISLCTNLRPKYKKMFVCPLHQVEKKCGRVDFFVCKVAFWGHFSANNTELYVRNTEWNEKRLNKLN